MSARTHASGQATRRLPRRFFVTEGARGAESADIISHLPDDCGVLLRPYAVSGGMAEIRALHKAARARRLATLVAGDPALAIALGASGTHLPEFRLSRPPDLALLARGGLLTAAVHSAGALLRAAALGADAVFLGPVYPTRSHPDNKPLGVLRFLNMVQLSPVPVYALGGMTEARNRHLSGYGVAGYGAIGELLGETPLN